MDLRTELSEFTKRHNLFSEKTRIIAAVSGGVDSMVMLDLLRKTGSELMVAHCNFNLRGEESDSDEDFLRNYCNSKGIGFKIKSFNTSSYASENKISVQMAARELRYSWFEELREDEGYDCIAVAHNRNDNVETFLINLSRGTGIKGLKGMSVKSGNIIRPLMFASRDDIAGWAREHSIPFREDSSNVEDKYLRNRIRHNIIPLFNEINPQFVETVCNTMERLDSLNSVYEDLIKELRSDFTREAGRSVEVDINRLKETAGFRTILFDLFREWNLGSTQVGLLEELIDTTPGKQLFTSTHRITRDRNKLIISQASVNKVTEKIFASEEELLNDRTFREAVVYSADGFSPSGDPCVAYLDADLINYPVRIRRWRDGDSFIPFGMNGTKKISDLLVDLKISLVDKETCQVLVSGDIIAWVIPYRSDNRFRVSGSTKRVLELTY